ncbi:MAG: hypothetical protein QW733_01865 [Desulfurococcaceae archaeon]
MQAIRDKLAKRKKLYLYVIGIAFGVSLVLFIFQALFSLHGKRDYICENGVQLSFLKNYSFLVVSNKLFECQPMYTDKERVVVCKTGQYNDFESLLLYDLSENKAYVAVKGISKPITRDDCFLADFAYSSSFSACVNTQKAIKCQAPSTTPTYR